MRPASELNPSPDEVSKGPPDGSPAERLRRWKRFAGGFAVGACCAILLALIALSRGSERLAPLDRERLAAAEGRWRRAHVGDYRMRVAVSGAQNGVYEVTVINGQPTSAARIPGGAMPRRTWDYWTVAGLFDMLDTELAAAEDPERGFGVAADSQVALYAEFDDATGRPVAYRRRVLGSDIDVSWRVVGFIVPVDGAAPREAAP